MINRTSMTFVFHEAFFYNTTTSRIAKIPPNTYMWPHDRTTIQTLQNPNFIPTPSMWLPWCPFSFLVHPYHHAVIGGDLVS